MRICPRCLNLSDRTCCPCGRLTWSAQEITDQLRLRPGIGVYSADVLCAGLTLLQEHGRYDLARRQQEHGLAMAAQSRNAGGQIAMEGLL